MTEPTNYAPLLGPHFSPDEFPPGELELADPILLVMLTRLRAEIGRPIYPSPVTGALARRYGSTKSRHYAVDRKSTAIDVFTKCPSALFFTRAVHLFGGVGFYSNGKFGGAAWPRWHLDLRDVPLWWWSPGADYHYATTAATAATFLLELTRCDPPFIRPTKRTA